jgi:oligopeptide transport system substrate-binding protein
MDNERKLAGGLPGALADWSRRDFLRRIGLGTGALALSGGAGALLEACGSSGGGGGNLAKDQTLRVWLNNELSSFDPNTQQWGYDAQLTRNTFEPLLRPKLDLTDVQPAAASGYTVSSDGLTWTFNLRQNAKWSDGQPVTAKDFLYAYQRLLNPLLNPIPAPYADPFFDGSIKGGDQYGNITAASQLDAYMKGLGLEAKDDHTFVITLQAPAPYFKWIVSLWVAAPVRKDVVEANPGGWAQDPKTAISNGWFKLSEYAQKDHITIVPNEHYWGSKPTLTKIVLPINTDESKAYAMYQNGELDMATVPLPDTKANASSPEVHKVPQQTCFWVTFNCLAPPFDNKTLRLAFAKAYDRTKFVADVIQGHGAPMETFLPKGLNGYDPSLGSIQKFDPAEAKKLLEQSGVSKDVINQVTFDYRASTPDNKTVAEYLVSQFNQNLGLNLQANPVDSKTMSNNLKVGKFKLFGLTGWGSDYPDKQDWYDTFITPPNPSSRGNNFQGYSNPDFDKLVKQADTTMDESKRNQMYAQAHKMLCQDAPVGFLYQRYGWSLVKKYVSGLNVTSIDDYPYIGDFDSPSINIQSH